MLTLTVFLAVGISIYILFPLMVPPSDRLLAADTAGESAADEARTDKELYLKAIKDIDFEYASDKINEEDYSKLKNMYSKKAIEAMEKIEELEKVKEPESNEGIEGDDDE